MAIEIKAPAFPESVADGEVAVWHKAEGDAVARDELLVEIETDKVVMEVVAPESGVLTSIVAIEGETIESEALLAVLEAGEVAQPVTSSEPSSQNDGPEVLDTDSTMGPAARAMVDEHGLDPSVIEGSGKGGRVTKEDVTKHLKNTSQSSAAKAQSAPPAANVAPVASPSADAYAPSSERVEKRVPMTRMRSRIAERLLEASQQTAMLTTFNEVNMAPLMKLRSYPAVNASIDGNDVVYHGYQDIGVAVSTNDGLVVPVLRDADFMSIADVEAAIRALGLKAQDKKLTIEEMTGGTFTVSNGGVFGSLLSTPILNPPQTGILGMHTIQERPVAVNGEVVIQPMMYLALSYDHRLIDGKTAVQFLVTVKGFIEDPARILLQL